MQLLLGNDPVTIAENIRLLRESGLDELTATRRALAQARRTADDAAREAADSSPRDTDAPDSGIVSPSAQGRALADAAEAEADVDATTRAPKTRIRGGTSATPR